MSASVEEICQKLEAFCKEGVARTEAANSTAELNEVRVEYLGKKGKFSQVLSVLRDLDGEGKKAVGQTANRLRQDFESKLSSKVENLSLQEMNEKLLQDQVDASAPGVFYPKGFHHPIRQTLREAIRIFELAGLSPVYGPEVEYEDYCFDRLNFEPGHAARDMQATFFVEGGEKPLVLRTHTSPVQVRVLMDVLKRKEQLPIRAQAPGRVYRMDDDRTHSPMFHQIEGLAVDRIDSVNPLNMGDLRAVFDFFCRSFFGTKTKVRFRPSYFPFVEPGAEVDISCVFCSGKGCKVCSHSGWLEIAGAGLVHPKVFEACGWNPDEVMGWAFGIGIERIAMLKLGIPDLRAFFENRLSFLRSEV